jgi:hypothetical protein
MNEKNVSSWAMPGALSGFAWIGLWYAIEWFGSQAWQLAIMVVAVVLMAAAVANLWEYARERNLEAFKEQQESLTRTPDALLFQEARMLAAQSPELAGELARRVGRPDLILFPSKQGRQALIRLAGGGVTLPVALEGVGLSGDVNMAAQRNFSESTYLYDPNHEMPDRKQWMQLNWILAREGMVTRYVPNQATNTAPMWLPPWTPARIVENWLLPSDLLKILEPYLVDEEVEA